MNIQPYRGSFSVFVADSDVARGNEVASALTLGGYTCEHKLNIEGLLVDIKKSPPHIIIMHYQDGHFFSGEESHKQVLEQLVEYLPEVHILMLAEEKDIQAACELYAYSIYDCFSWPMEHPMQLLRAVDRAAETDFYMYLNEQLKEKYESEVPKGDVDFAMYNVWWQEMEKATSYEQLVDLWLRESARVLQTDEALYMRFIESKKSLIVSQSFGLPMANLVGVGLDLASSEPGFEVKMLREPQKLLAMNEFVSRGLRRDHAVYYPLVYKDQILGVFLLPSKKGEFFNRDSEDHPYLKSGLHIIQRQLDFMDMQKRLKKFSVYDDISEAFSLEVTRKKVREEISRARRILRPVSLILVSIDGYDDLSLAQATHSIEKLLKGIAEVLIKNSRLNDLVGRVAHDQFAVCLPHTDKRGAMIKAERFRRLIEKADFSAILGARSKMTVSLGVSEYPSVCHDDDGLFKSAESVLLEIKKVGGNKANMAQPGARFVPDFMVGDGKNLSNVGR